MKGNVQLRVLSLAVIAYMLLAFAWWSVLLYTKNKDAFVAKRELMKIGMVAEGVVTNEAAFQRQEKYLELKAHYDRQAIMIMGEALVFVLSLVVGMWLINRAYYKEVFTANQQRNFLLSITHELKSPIASIRLVLETFLKRTLRPDQTQKLAGNALQETERLHTLVNDLLLSARLEAAYQLNEDQVNLRELFQEVIARMEHRHPEAVFQLNEAMPIAPIQGDRTALTSVAVNLMENAVKYSPAPARVDITLTQVNGQAEIKVADQGLGIDEKEKKLIFEKFYRVGNEDTRSTKGTGLGLYIVKQIVKAHHGEITVTDHQPKGTVFTITLPLGAAM